MPVYKDPERGTWTARFYYTDWTGKRKQKKKRGFKRQADAKQYEREFLIANNAGRGSGTADMTFKTLYDEYINDCGLRIKASSLNTISRLAENHILPFFKDRKLSEMTPRVIRQWQNELLKNDSYSSRYLRSIHIELSSIFNYAIKYYELPSNPCTVVGNICKPEKKIMKIWTKEEWQKANAQLKDGPAKIAIEILFWTGIRRGELMALTPEDIFPDRISITKTYSRVKGSILITSPKTLKSIRDVTIPEWLYNDIQNYMHKLYGLKSNERIITIAPQNIKYNLDKAASRAGLEQIRIHDLRHSHASMLIDMGYNIFAVSERLGHENVSTTMNVYGHLYPERKADIAKGLNKAMSDL